MGGKRKKHKPTYKPAKQRRVELSEPPLRVFISSRGNMEKERKLVHRTVDSIPITRPWSFEYTSASSQETKEAYVTKVRECEIFLLLLGESYSDHVELEYQTAVDERKAILAFINSSQKETRQDEFIRLLPFKPALYNGLDHLRELVYVAVYDELNRGYRQYRSTIRSSDKPKVIQNLPISGRKFMMVHKIKTKNQLCLKWNSLLSL